MFRSSIITFKGLIHNPLSSSTKVNVFQGEHFTSVIANASPLMQLILPHHLPTPPPSWTTAHSSFQHGRPSLPRNKMRATFTSSIQPGPPINEPYYMFSFMSWKLPSHLCRYDWRVIWLDVTYPCNDIHSCYFN